MGTEVEKEKIIKRVIKLARSKLSQSSTFPLFKRFAERYYRLVPEADLKASDLHFRVDSLLSHWQLFENRGHEDFVLRIQPPRLATEQGYLRSSVELVLLDQPYWVDSLRLALQRAKVDVELMIHCGAVYVLRDSEGRLLEVDAPCDRPSAVPEAIIFFEIEALEDAVRVQELLDHLRCVLRELRRAWISSRLMMATLHNGLKYLQSSVALPSPPDEIYETQRFLSWLSSGNFIFLGYLYYSFDASTQNFSPDFSKGLGILAENEWFSRTYPEEFLATSSHRPLEAAPGLLAIAKLGIRSFWVRPSYLDWVSLRHFDEQGQLIGEGRWLGLFSDNTELTSVRDMPFVRKKIDELLRRAQFDPASYAHRTLENIVLNFPRSELYQATVDQLFELAMGIFQLQDRRRVHVFLRRGIYGRFYTSVLCIPNDVFNAERLAHIEHLFVERFQALDCQRTVQFMSETLTRIYIILRVSPDFILPCSEAVLEEDVAFLCHDWTLDLHEALLQSVSSHKAEQLSIRYARSFPLGYRERFRSEVAVADIQMMEALSEEQPMDIYFYRIQVQNQWIFKLRLIQTGQGSLLSDIFPILENLGLKVINEQSFEIVTTEKKIFTVSVFRMLHLKVDTLDLEKHRPLFHDAFKKIWRGESENDGFNRLVLLAGISWREVSFLRAYAKYFKQTEFKFSQPYIEETLARHPEVVSALMTLFHARFNPMHGTPSKKALHKLEDRVELLLHQVSNLDEDRILRRYLSVIRATVRTNVYQVVDHAPKPYLSFKIDSKLIPELPLPVPFFEIFVYSTRFEGVHLRTSMVARGGIRWSDRREDFRSEILGLMKAQKVKNAIIVPSGAKGGFVCKLLPIDAPRDIVMKEAIACYEDFIRGLLDLSDNYVGSETVSPHGVVCHDAPDPYLVVAADKGTATFSDYANRIAEEYRFWLGDAFASGGRAGYDHKAMAITARGAWESVKRHFLEEGIQHDKQLFSVVGIGDLSGDVFSNGLLYSKNIRLLAAFDHRHIFLDPNPDALLSYEERLRVAQMPRSTWEDYNKALISKGGGVFSRQLKSIVLSPEVKKWLGLRKDSIVPSELIRSILRAPVDLLWNGGIGTFVKASFESHEEVGDRSTEAIRVNASDLRCRVVGEGGNLGFTQAARVEYALLGGRINTDFIDNSGGVNCSDHEVNLKILFNQLQGDQRVPLEERNALLKMMTDEVAALVLRDNQAQAFALSIAEVRALHHFEMHRLMVQSFEQSGRLDRALEKLPTDIVWKERRAKGKSLTRPELAVLQSYAISAIKDDLLSAEDSLDPSWTVWAEQAFPSLMVKRFRSVLPQHRLRREILATQITNTIVHEMGFAFVFRLVHETLAKPFEVVRAYLLVRDLFEVGRCYEEVLALDGIVRSEVQYRLWVDVMRLLRRSTRWWLKTQVLQEMMQEGVTRFRPMFRELIEIFPQLLSPSEQRSLMRLAQNHRSEGVPQHLAMTLAIYHHGFTLLDMISVAHQLEIPIERVARVHLRLGVELDLGAIRNAITAHSASNRWEAMAREMLRDTVDDHQRRLCLTVLKDPEASAQADPVRYWLRLRDIDERWEQKLLQLRTLPKPDLTVYTVLLNDLAVLMTGL